MMQKIMGVGGRMITSVKPVKGIDMKILAFDTSNQPLSVALFDGGQLVAQKETDIAKNHSEQLLPIIDTVVRDAGWQPADLERIIVSQGPGSYTGLRLAVTTAKTLAFTLGIELVGVSSLALLAMNIQEDNTLIIPMMDARNGNVYAGQYTWVDGQLINIVPDQHTAVVDMPTKITADYARVVYVGDGAIYQEQLQARVPSAEFAVGAANKPHAANMLALASTSVVLKNMDDIHQFVPNYLRVTQAEADWLKAHPEANHENYVEQVK